jgi:glutaredoxin
MPSTKRRVIMPYDVIVKVECPYCKKAKDYHKEIHKKSSPYVTHCDENIGCGKWFVIRFDYEVKVSYQTQKLNWEDQ